MVAERQTFDWHPGESYKIRLVGGRVANFKVVLGPQIDFLGDAWVKGRFDNCTDLERLFESEVEGAERIS